MGENSMSPADIAALTGNGVNGENGFGWFLLIFILFAAMGGWGKNNNAPAPGPVIPPNVATQTDVQNAINSQTVNTGIQQILLSSANNNYETANLIANQTNALTQQNYNNQINAIQGFNNATTAMNAGFNNLANQSMQQTYQLSNKLDNLASHMDQCCCTIQQKLLQQQLDEANRKLLEEQNKNNIAQQSQYLLGTMGRYVAWAGQGSQSAEAAAARTVAG